MAHHVRLVALVACLAITGTAEAGKKRRAAMIEPEVIEVPVPSVAGVSLDSLALRADSGYVLVSGQVH